MKANDYNHFLNLLGIILYCPLTSWLECILLRHTFEKSSSTVNLCDAVRLTCGHQRSASLSRVSDCTTDLSAEPRPEPTLPNSNSSNNMCLKLAKPAVVIPKQPDRVQVMQAVNWKPVLPVWVSRWNCRLLDRLELASLAIGRRGLCHVVCGI